MKKISLYLLFVSITALSMPGCHKETSNFDTPSSTSAQYTKQIVNSNLEWKYDANKEIISARLAELGDPGSPYSADSIRSVYLYSDGFYHELPGGNVANPTGIYYAIDIKSLVLYKKIRLDLQTGDDAFDATIKATIVQAAIAKAFSLPILIISKEAKVVFR